MRHKFLVLTVKKLLKSVYIRGSYRKIKTGVSLFLDHPVGLFFIPLSYSAPVLPMFPLEFRGAVKRQKTRVIGLLCGEGCVTLT